MHHRATRLLSAVALVVAMSAGATTAASSATSRPACPLPVFGPGRDYHPDIDPSSFSADVDNPWFPLTPGTTYVYAGLQDGKKGLDVVTVSSRTRIVDGVRTRRVEDRLFLDAVLAERTTDYYAQDSCGNVWYFGEDTAELDRQGHVIDTSGTFHAGVDGAQPGVFMQAQPELRRRFRQEWLPGEAEDTFRAVDLETAVSAPFGDFHHALRTEEQTALEPGVLDNKYYVRGIGEVVEVTVKGPREFFRLVDVLS
jgi:hypothetical protein